MIPEDNKPTLDRRLEIVRKVVNHDLANQLVVIQGLFQLLALEDQGLSSEGREYLQRLGGASARTLEMVQVLKKILAIGAKAEKKEVVRLEELAREAAAEIKQLFPGTRIEYHFSERAVEVCGGQRSLLQAVAELLRLAVAAAGDRPLDLGTARTAAAMVLWMGPGKIPAPLLALPGSPEKDDRLELILVRELVHSWDGSVRLLEEPRGSKWFALVCPLAKKDEGL